MNKKKLMISLVVGLLSLATHAADNLPDLHVQGKNLVDANGNTVVLHGVMDTPNRYFNNWLWQQWKPGYGTEDIKPCLEYFDKLFAGITDKSQGAYCTVFRLHMDPCWTNDPDKKSTGENDISAFSETRYKVFLDKLYLKLVERALYHGLYVASKPFIQEHSGQVSIELANEPIHVSLANGQASNQALHDFFQPVVDEIRATGFKGIIWVPGTGYQSNYTDYATHPITDSEKNFGYAVHVYSGWYGGMSDSNCDHDTFIKNFKNQVPVVETNPIMVTEIDWSPEDPDRASEGHYNEWGQWTQPNLGTWATASTSKWGNAWKAVHDYYGNIGMTLTHSQEYIDIEEYLKSGKYQPGLQNAKKYNLFEECCGYACMNWYKEWYLKQTTTGIRHTETQASPLYTYYYNIEGKRIEKPQGGVYIIKEVLSNGKARSRKVYSGK